MKIIKRDWEETIEIFKYNISMLEHLCCEFDKGRTESALWIAVVLRTLLYTNRSNNISILDQLKAKDKKYDLTFLSTSFPKPTTKGSMQGWDFSNISNATITTASVFAGLLIKKVCGRGNAGYEVDTEPMRDRYSQKNRRLSLDGWFDEIIFEDYDKNFSLSRLKTIKVVADKDGGAHLDSTIPEEYDAFRRKDLFKLRCNNEAFFFTRNPIYVSIRQIAWEVLESFKESEII